VKWNLTQKVDMPTLTAPTTVTFSLQIDQILTLTNNFGVGSVVLSAQRGGDTVFDYTGDQLRNTPIFSSGSQGIVTITHLSGSLTYNVTDSAFPLFVNTPRVLFQSSIPFILAGGTATNQFTISATGALSNLPTLPITSGNAFIYLPAITGLTAGWYYSNILSATTAQISTSRYTSGDPLLAIPAVFTNPAGITAGNYSQTTATGITAHQITLPGGSIGPSGNLYGELSMTCPNSANTKGLRINLAAAIVGYVDATTTPGATLTSRVSNRNSQSSQVNFVNSGVIGGTGQQNSGASYASVNTAVDQTVSALAQLNNAAEFVLVERFRLEVMYGA
jgi:hypothetical protein